MVACWSQSLHCVHVHTVTCTCRFTVYTRVHVHVCPLVDVPPTTGISNIEMECTALAALCHKARVKCAVVCVTLLDRLLGDQVDIPPEQYKKYQQRPQALVAGFIKSRLGL